MSGDTLIESLPFDPAAPNAALAQLPTSAAVFALYGAEAHAEPYIGRTPTSAPAWHASFSRRPNIHAACNLPAAFAA